MFTVYMANNMLDKAKSLVSQYPVDVKSAYDISEHARMMMVTGQWQEGYASLRSAWDKDRDEYKIYDVLAQIAVYNRDDLLENVTSLLEKNPNDLAYKMWLAKIYSSSDATANEAINLLEELKTHDVGKIEIKLIESAALQSLNQDDKADELIIKVIEENKEDYRVLHTAGWYYLNKKDYINAEKYCRESIIKNKNYPDNYGFLMTEILKAQGRTGEGEPYFRTAIFKEPYNYNTMLTIANYYWYTAKNTEKALENFKFAEIVKPNDPDIKYNMALINITSEKQDEAINLLNQSIKLSESTAKYHRTLGTLYLLNKKPQEAIKEIRYAYAADQTDIMTLNNAGCYYISQDVNLEKGEYNLRKALEGITDSTDKYTSDTIKENYKKAKELLDKYNSGSGNELKMPDFVLFY
jgi:Tfp pilus assembly protein PilF